VVRNDLATTGGQTIAAMAQQNNFRALALFFGVLTGSAGLLFVLMSLGVLAPLGPTYGPSWVIFCAGLVFLVGAALLALRALAGDPAREGELPPDAPRVLHLVQYVLPLTIFVSMVLIASWVAFGEGERSFTASGTFVAEGKVSQTPGRVMFGIGAVVMWLCTVVMAIDGARRLARRG
jgi:hypothetical protein